MELTSKVCTKCKIDKPVTEFTKDLNVKSGRVSRCKTCKCNITKEWCKKNKLKKRIQSKRHYEKNKLKKFAQKKFKLNTNLFFKTKENLLTLVQKTIKRKGYTKRSRTHQLLGADYETVFAHLQETARINYGFWMAEIEYHIDHIVPCSTAKTEEDLIKLQHYSNLQLLRPADNLAKSNRLDYITPYMEFLNEQKRNT